MGPNGAAAILFTVSGVVGVAIVIVLCGLIFGWFKCKCMNRRKDGGGRDKQGSHLREFKLRPQTQTGVYAYTNEMEQGLRVPSSAAGSSLSSTKGSTSSEASVSKVLSPTDSLSLYNTRKDRALPHGSYAAPPAPASTYSPPSQGRPGRYPIPKMGVLGGPVTYGGPLVPKYPRLSDNNGNSSDNNKTPLSRVTAMSHPHHPQKTLPNLPPSTPNWPLQSPPHNPTVNPDFTPPTNGTKSSHDSRSTLAAPNTQGRQAPRASIPRQPLAGQETDGPLLPHSANLDSLVIGGVLHPAFRPQENQVWTQKPTQKGEQNSTDTSANVAL